MNRRTCLAAVLLLILMTASGCGSGGKDEGITVTGTVTLDGQPLPIGQIVFEIPNSTEQRIGGIENGKFEVKGVPVGKVRAAIRTSIMQGRFAAEQKFASKAGGTADKPAFTPVPTKYEDIGKANLEYDVESGKSITIELKK